MLRRITTLAALLLFATPLDMALAQQYLFSVPRAQMLVTVQPDAGVRIDYEFTFHNSLGGHAIDIVDIGVPRSDFSLSSARAWIDDRPLTDIRVSTEVKPGFEVHLGSSQIPPGRSGRLHVQFVVPNMVYQDTTRNDYASLRITPTWFGGPYVLGTTQLIVAIELPKSVKPDEAIHQGLPFTRKAATDQGAVVGWHFPNTRLTGQHMVAVSFPKRDLQRVIRQTAIDLLARWFADSPQARITLGVVFLVLLAILFFRFSGGTGFSVYFVLGAVACVLFYFSPGWHLLSMPVVILLIGFNEWLLGRRAMRYMPPIAQVEGGGIKRGLTAPEAAVLLELPLARVLSLVIFGMLKKGMLRQVQADPLMVAVNEPFLVKDAESQPGLPAKDARPSASPVSPAVVEQYSQAAVRQGVVVNAYEHPFLFLIQNNPDKPLRAIDFSIAMKTLITASAARMKGFDLSDTKDYYRAIIRKAVTQAAAIGDIPQREKAIDRDFDWILMDDHFPTVFTYGRPYHPTWSRGSTVSTPGTPAGAPTVEGSTSFGDVASSFAGWAQNTMGSMSSALSPGALQLSHPAGGFLDLSGADYVAGEFFQALAESGGGSGGGGSGCACAGCACACACAGGGR